MEDHTSLTQLAFVLAAAFGGGAMLQRLHQPVLVGYILAGVILGPSVLGIVSDKDQIAFMAELGILLLMFVVGIELDLKRFAPVYKPAIITTVLQITAGVLGMFALGMVFDWPLARILMLGFALSLSSTAVAIKILKDAGVLDSMLGRTATGVLIAQDIAVIPMLLIMTALSGSGNGVTVLELTKIGLSVGLLAGLVILLKLRPAWMDKMIDAIPVEGQTAVVALAFCFVFAALAGLVGLSTAYGAFIAGLVIGNTAKRHAYEENIRPIFDVLMMIFFLSIGLLIDLSFIQEKFWRILILLMLAMTIKTGINVLIFRLEGFSRRNSLLMGAVLGQIGEFSFVLAALGLATGAIIDVGYKYVVSIIALSLVLTPIWLHALRVFYIRRRYRLYRRNVNKRRKATQTGA